MAVTCVMCGHIVSHIRWGNVCYKCRKNISPTSNKFVPIKKSYQINEGKTYAEYNPAGKGHSYDRVVRTAEEKQALTNKLNSLLKRKPKTETKI